MDTEKIKTLGELKATPYESKSIREELRANMLSAIEKEEVLFPGIIGFEQTVIPAIVNAVLSRHDIILLGLRGQAKTRIMRQLVNFLDEWVPVVEGSPLNEDPLDPVLNVTVNRIQEMGDDLPITWMHRRHRFNEKLATPDVSMVDLIGDIDPIKASREKMDLSDEEVIHYGIIPRTNRGLFLINELPDLQARIQVGLLNILEEKDMQIRGFPIRLKLDIAMLFTANPEDYTNRGSIITPLKDRIASQIITHYPHDIEQAMEITRQEADVTRHREITVPEFIREIIEEIAVQARESEHVDQTSGVSARLPIAMMELVVSNVERRSLVLKEDELSPRTVDLFAAVPGICGKVELVYEGEQEGPTLIAGKLIGNAIKAYFTRVFPPLHENKRNPDPVDPLYSDIQHWFSSGNHIELNDFQGFEDSYAQLKKIDGLNELVNNHMQLKNKHEELAAMELVLEALHQNSLLSRDGLYGAVVYGDMLRQMMEE